MSLSPRLAAALLAALLAAAPAAAQQAAPPPQQQAPQAARPAPRLAMTSVQGAMAAVTPGEVQEAVALAESLKKSLDANEAAWAACKAGAAAKRADCYERVHDEARDIRAKFAADRMAVTLRYHPVPAPAAPGAGRAGR